MTRTARATTTLLSGSNLTVLLSTETSMFDTADDPLPIPQCCCCGYELHGADYGRLACWRCEERLYDRLNEVGELWAKLPGSAHRPVGKRSPGRSMSVHPGMPGNATVINLTAGGDDTPLGRLLAVEEDWRRARGFTVQVWRGSVEQTMPLVLRFLRDNLPWACGAHKNPGLLPDGSELLPDVQLLDEALRRTVGELAQTVTGERRPRTIPVMCGAEWDDGATCSAEIRVGAQTLRTVCPGCGAEWTREIFLRLAAEANQMGAAA
ncbi:hypothetical protein OG455_41685 [Kitasatospora sp. NBC_01287]|uniref:hypothetical protein n=1 Tax=Kitasatospora sp. NBC_01287 TaxID=2903573 RepID=UPI00225BC4E9|nr:hypothetical protein [Kitasatospora sp. NBC_01287]MCX4751752.1 hypothetical protein [Kitasatospora sp. NBC_01287]MCX4751956.1 hypothetical protein [Kitasatospora sp. NBC_01287]